MNKYVKTLLILTALLCIPSCTRIPVPIECSFAEILKPNKETQPYVSREFLEQMARHNRAVKHYCQQDTK